MEAEDIAGIINNTTIADKTVNRILFTNCFITISPFWVNKFLLFTSTGLLSQRVHQGNRIIGLAYFPLTLENQ